jgi:hypothetical protein
METPRSEPLPVAARADSRIPEAIAKETQTPIEIVRAIWAEEFESLVHDAKLTQYLGIIAGRRVKIRLRQH